MTDPAPSQAPEPAKDPAQPELTNQEIFNMAMAAMDRMARIGPSLFKYVWLGAGVHAPASSDALLGLTKVEVRFDSTDEGEPDWVTQERYEAILKSLLDGGLPGIHGVPRECFPPYVPHTMITVRYWMSDVAGYRDILYKVQMSGAGANPEQVRGLVGGA